MIQNATRTIETTRPVQPRLDTHLEASPTRATRKNTIETVTCPICQAVYAPAPQHTAFLAFSPRIMEAAFMQTCHFCFRCRQAACPQCWDFIQGVCAACDQEAGLPFRVAAPPLEGLLFPPPRLPSRSQEEAESPFVCLHTGRFQTQPSHIPPSQVSTPDATAGAETPEFNVVTSPRSFPQKSAILELEKRLAADEEDEDDEDELDEQIGPWRHIERVLVIVTMLVLLTIIVTIVLAELQANVNAQIARFAHIDIRAEIAYLLQLIGHIFKR